jgi:hypothetical protein
MEVYPKFIIETDEQDGDCLIIGKCVYHKELATDISKVKGGGWFKFNKANKTFIFFGTSHDFGKASETDVLDCIQRKKVFSDFINISDEFKFIYNDEHRETLPH